MDILKIKAWKIGSVAGILLGVFLFALAINELKSVFEIGHDYRSVNAITVTGKGEELAVPDIATFSFSVTESSKIVADAQEKATKKMNSALVAIRAGGVAEKDIKTTGYSINPRYEYIQPVCVNGSCPQGKSVLTGYEVSQAVEIKVRDITKAGKLFESIASLDVQNINNLSFSIDDIDGVKEKAQGKAIVDAKVKADKLADELGVRLGKILSFSDNSGSGYPYPMVASYGAADKSVMSARAETPEIPQGEQKVTSQVSITYEIR